MSKYTNARYPEKVNDVIDNEGKVKAEALPVDPQPKNKYPTLNYTLAEIKQYADVPVKEVPEDLISDIDEHIQPWWGSGSSTYIEFLTKDNYAFKGVVVSSWHPDSGTNRIDFVCSEGKRTATKIIYGIETDVETGDSRLFFTAIEVITQGE